MARHFGEAEGFEFPSLDAVERDVVPRHAPCAAPRRNEDVLSQLVYLVLHHGLYARVAIVQQLAASAHSAGTQIWIHARNYSTAGRRGGRSCFVADPQKHNFDAPCGSKLCVPQAPFEAKRCLASRSVRAAVAN